MEIQSVSQAQQVQTTQQRETASALNTDFETFLVMLTTQLQNQDPLNPLDSQDFAVQLATFSGVEQQVRTNELLETLKGSDLIELANLVGKEGRHQGPINFNGSPIPLQFGRLNVSDAADLIVLNQDGEELQRLNLERDVSSIEWAGVDSDGLPFDVGRYLFRIEHFKGGEVISTSPITHYSQIVEAREGDDGPEFVMADGTILPLSAITAFRDIETDDRAQNSRGY